MPLAERALEPGVRAALFDAAQADLVAFVDSALVRRVLDQVVVLRAAALAGANGVVTYEVMCVEGAEPPATILAGMLRRVVAP